MTDDTSPSSSPELTVAEAIVRRRSVRHFKPDPIPDETLTRLLALTVAAPSSWNLQPWRIVLIRDEERRSRLAEACYGQAPPREAPVSFVFAHSRSGWRDVLDDVVAEAAARGAWDEGYVETFRKYAPASQEGLGDRIREYNAKDAMIAATHLALAARSLGLGSTFMNGYAESRVKELIGAEGDDDICVALVMSIGVPETEGRNPGRLPLSTTVFDERLDTPHAS